MDANNGTHIKFVDSAAADTAATTTNSIDTKFNSFSKEQAINGDSESIFDEETAEHREGDYKRKQVCLISVEIPNVVLTFATDVQGMDAHVVCMSFAPCLLCQSPLTLLDRLAYQSTGVIYGMPAGSWRVHSNDPKATLEPVRYTSIHPRSAPIRATTTSLAPCP